MISPLFHFKMWQDITLLDMWEKTEAIFCQSPISRPPPIYSVGRNVPARVNRSNVLVQRTVRWCTIFIQTWNLSKILHRRIFRPKILYRQFHLISTVLVIKTQKNEWKWRNLHRWQKFYTAAGSDGIDKAQISPLKLYSIPHCFEKYINCGKIKPWFSCMMG